MISDKELMRISVIISVIGLIALFLIVTFMGPSRTAISELRPGEIIVAGGAVSDYSESKGNIFFTLTNGSSVRVVVFSTDAEKTHAFAEGDNVTVTGKAQFYMGEMEIVAKEVAIS